MLITDASQGVSNCYLFKSRLQEFAQKVGYLTPVYETVREGPSHEPSFRSTVIVNNVRYDSLPGFYNRKASEQSAAEVALLELSQSRTSEECISQPVHETGLCKNLLQEYAQKMNYAIPVYRCQIVENPCKVSLFSCTVETGGMKYIGAAARTKKEAEIKAARTALLAIQANISQSDSSNGDSVHTVIPCKKKAADLVIKSKENTVALKPKKRRYKKRSKKKKHVAVKGSPGQNKNNDSLMFHADDMVEPHGVNDSAMKATDFGVSLAEVTDLNCGGCFTNVGAASICYGNGELNAENNPPYFSDGGCFTVVGAASIPYCTVETGGMKYIGAAARTKKEAEIKAAQTALLPIQANISQSDSSNGDSVHTVIPCNKKEADLGIKSKKNTVALKPKKRRYKKRSKKKKHVVVKGSQGQNKNNDSLMVHADDMVEPHGVNDSAMKATDFGVSLAEVTDLNCGGCFTDVGAASICHGNGELNADNNPPYFSDGGCFTVVGAASIPCCNGDSYPDNNAPNFSDGGCFTDMGAGSTSCRNGDSNPDTSPHNFSDDRCFTYVGTPSSPCCNGDPIPDTNPPNFSGGLGCLVEEVKEVP